MNPAVMNVANVKYVITYALPDDVSQYDERSRQTIAQLKAYFSQPQFELVMRGQRYAIYRNSNVLPRAFLASGFEVMKDKDQLLSRLMSPGFDPTRTALLYADPQFTPTSESLTGGIEVASYDANRVRLKVTSSAACLAVLSENFQPDYRVTVDGKPAPVLRAYHTLRAVAVPAGEHELVFAYQSNYYRIGTWLTLTSMLFLCGTLAMSFITNRRKRGTSTHAGSGGETA
jgi:hypothetical protein